MGLYLAPRIPRDRCHLRLAAGNRDGVVDSRLSRTWIPLCYDCIAIVARGSSTSIGSPCTRIIQQDLMTPEPCPRTVPYNNEIPVMSGVFRLESLHHSFHHGAQSVIGRVSAPTTVLPPTTKVSTASPLVRLQIHEVALVTMPLPGIPLRRRRPRPWLLVFPAT